MHWTMGEANWIGTRGSGNACLLLVRCPWDINWMSPCYLSFFDMDVLWLPKQGGWLLLLTSLKWKASIACSHSQWLAVLFAAMLWAWYRDPQHAGCDSNYVKEKTWYQFLLALNMHLNMQHILLFMVLSISSRMHGLWKINSLITLFFQSDILWWSQWHVKSG